MDIKILRENFTSYMKSRYPNNNHIGVTVSMAFHLSRYGDEFGMDFHNILNENVIPKQYKMKLEEQFSKNGRKSPKSNAVIYEQALKLLLEYIHDTPKLYERKIINDKLQSKHTIKDIPAPSENEVKVYLAKWDSLTHYPEQETALNLLFQQTYKNNNNISEVLIKCSVLNDFYGTNIFKIYPVAKHIISIGFDEKLHYNDLQLVNNLSEGHGIKNNKTQKEMRLYSFASKYCSHHKPDIYPIYDSYVEKVLIHFRKTYNFADFKNDELKDYVVFNNVIRQFMDTYSLNMFSIKEIDQYLWLLGKDMFPKKFKQASALAPQTT